MWSWVPYVPIIWRDFRIWLILWGFFLSHESHVSHESRVVIDISNTTSIFLSRFSFSLSSYRPWTTDPDSSDVNSKWYWGNATFLKLHNGQSITSFKVEVSESLDLLVVSLKLTWKVNQEPNAVFSLNTDKNVEHLGYVNRLWLKSGEHIYNRCVLPHLKPVTKANIYATGFMTKAALETHYNLLYTSRSRDSSLQNLWEEGQRREA